MVLKAFLKATVEKSRVVRLRQEGGAGREGRRGRGLERASGISGCLGVSRDALERGLRVLCVSCDSWSSVSCDEVSAFVTGETCRTFSRNRVGYEASRT